MAGYRLPAPIGFCLHGGGGSPAPSAGEVRSEFFAEFDHEQLQVIERNNQHAISPPET
jgi:hypothetical protein